MDIQGTAQHHHHEERHIHPLQPCHCPLFSQSHLPRRLRIIYRRPEATIRNIASSFPLPQYRREPLSRLPSVYLYRSVLRCLLNDKSRIYIQSIPSISFIRYNAPRALLLRCAQQKSLLGRLMESTARHRHTWDSNPLAWPHWPRQCAADSPTFSNIPSN